MISDERVYTCPLPIHVCMHVSVYVSVCACLCDCVCMCLCASFCVYLCMRVCACLYVRVCLCLSVLCGCVCMLISPYLLCDSLKALDGIGSVEAGYLDSLLTDTAGVPCRTTGQHYYREYVEASP